MDVEVEEAIAQCLTCEEQFFDGTSLKKHYKDITVDAPSGDSSSSSCDHTVQRCPIAKCTKCHARGTDKFKNGKSTHNKDGRENAERCDGKSNIDDKSISKSIMKCLGVCKGEYSSTLHLGTGSCPRKARRLAGSASQAPTVASKTKLQNLKAETVAEENNGTVPSAGETNNSSSGDSGSSSSSDCSRCSGAGSFLPDSSDPCGCDPDDSDAKCTRCECDSCGGTGKSSNSSSRRLAENSFPPFEGLVRDIEEQGFVFRYN